MPYVTDDDSKATRRIAEIEQRLQEAKAEFEQWLAAGQLPTDAAELAQREREGKTLTDRLQALATALELQRALASAALHEQERRLAKASPKKMKDFGYRPVTVQFLGASFPLQIVKSTHSPGLHLVVVRVYATLSLSGPVEMLDAATGETLKTFEGTEGADEIVHTGELLLIYVGHTAQDVGKRRGKGNDKGNSVSRKLMALHPVSGETVWEKGVQALCHATLGANDKMAFYQERASIVAASLEDGEELWRSEPLSTPHQESHGWPSVNDPRSVRNPNNRASQSSRRICNKASSRAVGVTLIQCGGCMEKLYPMGICGFEKQKGMFSRENTHTVYFYDPISGDCGFFFARIKRKRTEVAFHSRGLGNGTVQKTPSTCSSTRSEFEVLLSK